MPTMTSTILKPKRRFFRFSLRAMLLLVTVIGVTLGWFSWKRGRVREREVVETKFESLGGNWSSARYCVPYWARSVVGKENYFSLHSTFYDLDDIEGIAFTLGSSFGDDHLPLLFRTRNISSVDLMSTRITDRGLRHLQQLARLNRLNLSTLPITDVGIREVGGCAELIDLDLSQTQITDSGLRYLKDLPHLQRLSLALTEITDEGLDFLKAVPSLVWIDLDGTQVTKEGIKRLRQSRGIKCEVVNVDLDAAQPDDPSKGFF